MKKGKIIFITGGARSGKSDYALKLCLKLKKVAFIPTCIPKDNEMAKRIKKHQDARPVKWQTFEPDRKLDIVNIIEEKIGHDYDALIIDCLTMLVSGYLCAKMDEKNISARIQELLKLISSRGLTCVIVSNEVGMGLVPENRLGRKFRDIAGRINQLVAQAADEGWLMVSGYPLRIK